MFKHIMAKLGYVTMKEHTDTVSDLMIKLRVDEGYMIADAAFRRAAVAHINQAVLYLEPDGAGTLHLSFVEEELKRAITLLDV